METDTSDDEASQRIKQRRHTTHTSGELKTSNTSTSQNMIAVPEDYPKVVHFAPHACINSFVSQGEALH